MFKKFDNFFLNESKTFVLDYKEKRQKVVFELAEECSREMIAFMQEKGRELLDYKAYDHYEYDSDQKDRPMNGEIHMLFSGKSPEFANTFIKFMYLNSGGMMHPFFWLHYTLGDVIDKNMIDHKKTHNFDSIEKDYQSRKNYSWDVLKTDV